MNDKLFGKAQSEPYFKQLKDRMSSVLGTNDKDAEMDDVKELELNHFAELYENVEKVLDNLDEDKENELFSSWQL